MGVAAAAADFFSADFTALFLVALADELFFFGEAFDFAAGVFFLLDGILATAAATSNDSDDSATVIARASISSALASLVLCDAT